ncbi:GNAT family N-acetyltransferase [Halobacillus sp. Marseille-Q1614]|uniref:GNAT family N-acetyltransferase n=1 Tax=Halobacillus sp. Marseille-Q1614 TaxID=2709134 RepID=UPI00156FFF84|nr:GNAT family N-acetyltransferase [Halobacillus sp. Marseille-Q1614]
MKKLVIRSFQERDIDAILELNRKEGWEGLVSKEDTLHAWINSEPALVAVVNQEIVGYLRGITDAAVTLYISEILVREEDRGKGVSLRLIQEAHSCYPSTRMEMLATGKSEEYYKKQGFRPFYGFRKAAEEFKRA